MLRRIAVADNLLEVKAKNAAADSAESTTPIKAVKNWVVVYSPVERSREPYLQKVPGVRNVSDERPEKVGGKKDAYQNPRHMHKKVTDCDREYQTMFQTVDLIVPRSISFNPLI